MEQRTFTWFPKLTRVMASLPDELAAAFAIAVANYGTYGIEPSFDNPIMEAVFEGVREDVDNSANNRSRNKGGRPSQKKPSASRKTTMVPKPRNQGSKLAKPRFRKSETPVSTLRKPRFRKPRTPLIYTKPSHTKPSQAKPR